MTLCDRCAEIGPEQLRNGVYHDDAASRPEFKVNLMKVNQKRTADRHKPLGFYFRVQGTEYGKTRTDLKPLGTRVMIPK